MYFDEDLLLDLRLNVLEKSVKKFVITEANYMHDGSPRKLKFDFNNFKRFKDKIIYIPVTNPPPNIKEIKKSDTEHQVNVKKILNAWSREKYQRDMLKNGLKQSQDDDFIFISDVDEIPNLDNLNLNNVKNRKLIFKQKMIYWKFNLCYEEYIWHGTKACRKKDFISPNWMRDIKNKKYEKWRFDTLFSKKKYNDIFFVNNGGWHFTNIKTPEEIQEKLTKYLHHAEYQESGLQVNDIKEIMKNKKVPYNHNLKKSASSKSKWGAYKNLNKIDFQELPSYIGSNKKKYKDWLDL